MTQLATTGARVDWAAIMAGAVLATAVGLILLAFGGALGLSIVSPYEREGTSAAAFVIAAGLWLLWVQLLSFSIGGYVAARLRTVQPDANEHEIDVRDGLHGVLAWGVGVLAAAVIAFAGIGGATSAAQNADSPRDMAATVATAISDEIDEAAAAEPAANPEASDEGVAERRAEVARKLTILAAFASAASLMVGAAAAFFAAGFGGKHRDQNTRLAFFDLRGRPVAGAERIVTVTPERPPGV